ncbi:MAG: HRDC domain-containing protein, partial [Methanosarcina flavescens]
PYIIFSDTTLKEMSTSFPRNHEEFHSITGVGEHKLRKYGDVFLKEIENYCRDYNLMPDGKPESPEITRRDPEYEEITSEELIPNGDDSETEIGIIETKMPDSEADDMSSLETGDLLTKRRRYLDTSIQDWSERNSLTGNSGEIDSAEALPESESVDVIKASPVESVLSETDSLERTFSLFQKGFSVYEIAEIQGINTRVVFRQLEELALTGDVRGTGRIFPPERQLQIKAALESLELEVDSLIRARVGENCQEEEMKFIKALLLSRICFSRPENCE